MTKNSTENKNLAYYQRLAEPILADAFWSEWDNLLSSEGRSELMMLDSEVEEINQKYKKIREITERMLCLCYDFDIDLPSILPIELIQKIEEHLNAHWQGNLTLLELFQIEELAASRAVCAQLGMGISPDDDQHIADLFAERGVKMPPSCFESPYDQVWDLCVSLETKLALQYPAKFAEEVVGNWDSICRFDYELISNLPDPVNWAFFTIASFADPNSNDEVKKEVNTELIESEILSFLDSPDISRTEYGTEVMIGVRVYELNSKSKQVTNAFAYLAALHRAIAIKGVLNEEMYQNRIIANATLRDLQ